MGDLKFLESLTSSFENLPGVGRKTAKRYAYHVLEKMTEDQVVCFAETLINTKRKVKNCPICGMISLDSPCEICTSENRDHSKIMVVKDTKDIIAIDSMGEYNGMYHSLGGLLSPIDGIGPSSLNISLLEKRLNNEVEEVIIATSFTPSGEMTALYLEKILSKDNLIVSRLGYGIPAGGDIENVDDLTFKRAFSNRTNNMK